MPAATARQEPALADRSGRPATQQSSADGASAMPATPLQRESPRCIRGRLATPPNATEPSEKRARCCATDLDPATEPPGPGDPNGSEEIAPPWSSALPPGTPDPEPHTSPARPADTPA